MRAWKGGNRGRKCGEIVLVTATLAGYVVYFCDDIGADTFLDEYFDSGMNSGVDIYDTAHRERCV